MVDFFGGSRGGNALTEAFKGTELGLIVSERGEMGGIARLALAGE